MSRAETAKLVQKKVEELKAAGNVPSKGNGEDKSAKIMKPTPKAAPISEPTKKVETTGRPAPAVESKVETTKPTVEPKAEEKPATMPGMPADFCLTESDWKGTEIFFSEASKSCIACKAAHPTTYDVCSARHHILAAPTKKARKVSDGAKASPKRSGAGLQTVQIDDLLMASTPIADIYAAVAEKHYGNSIPPARRRVESHIKAIREGTYVKAGAMSPFVAYLSAATAPSPAQ